MSAVVLAGLWASAGAGGESGAAKKAGGESGARTIVDTHSLFRCNFETNGMFVTRADGSWWPREPKGGKAPPEGWAAPEFDDSAWPAIPGPFFPTGRYGRYGYNFRTGIPNSMSTICLRACFEVSDPAAAGRLTLDLSYRGGVVVYLNGEEVKRAHLPEGKLEPLTMAEGYPKEAYTKPKGGIIRAGWKDPDRYRKRVEKRVRHLRGLVLPVRLLRKGVNVLAVRLQSAPHHELTLVKGRRGKFHYHAFRSSGEKMAHWVTVGMPDISLRATGGGVRPALDRPKGLQVYNQSPFQLVYDIDHAPRGTGLKPVRICAARNGRFAGQIVVACDAPVSGLEATVGELRREGGTETMPGSAVQLSYPQPTLHDPGGGWRLPGAHPRASVHVFDSLSDRPPAKIPVRTKPRKGSRPFTFGAVQPLWLSAEVPADAAPGTYTGTLRLNANGHEPVEVPLKVRVCDWRVPPPHEWRTFVDFMESPESVFIQYKTKPWSEEHWRHLEASFKVMGSVGNKSVYLRIIAKTESGNSQTILRWVRRPDGSLEPDFSVVDRYLALAKKYLVEPQMICLYVWERPYGGGYFGRTPAEWKKLEVTVHDPETGESRLEEVAAYNEMEKVRAFWKPAAEGLRERLAKLGWSDAMMLGIGDDWQPAEEVVKLWKELLPEAEWVSMGHDIVGGYKGGGKVGYCTTVWGPKWARSPSKRLYGWRRKQLICHFDRDSWRRSAFDQFFGCGYLAGEKNICGAQRGFGRMNADFFILPEAGGHKKNRGLITCRWPGHAKAQLSLRMNPFVWPGPDGPVSTVRMEMVREGLMECEARIVVEAALLDKAARARLGESKANELEALLVERTRWTLSSGGTYGAYKYIGSDWRGRRAALFDAAAEVNRLLGP
jgi:hypothetical protein